jgi:hypothetical protein
VSEQDGLKTIDHRGYIANPAGSFPNSWFITAPLPW